MQLEFVDYGSKMQCSKSEVFTLMDEFSAWPHLAHWSRLAGVRPPVTRYDKACSTRFQQLVHNIDQTKNKITIKACVINKEDNGKQVVMLFNAKGESIEDILVAEKHVRREFDPICLRPSVEKRQGERQTMTDLCPMANNIAKQLIEARKKYPVFQETPHRLELGRQFTEENRQIQEDCQLLLSRGIDPNKDEVMEDRMVHLMSKLIMYDMTEICLRKVNKQVIDKKKKDEDEDEEFLEFLAQFEEGNI